MKKPTVYSIKATVGKLQLPNKEIKRIISIKKLKNCTTGAVVESKEIQSFIDVCLKGRIPLPATIKTEKIKTKYFVGKRIKGFLYDSQLEEFKIFKNYLKVNGHL